MPGTLQIFGIDPVNVPECFERGDGHLRRRDPSVWSAFRVQSMDIMQVAAWKIQATTAIVRPAATGTNLEKVSLVIFSGFYTRVKHRIWQQLQICSFK